MRLNQVGRVSVWITLILLVDIWAAVRRAPTVAVLPLLDASAESRQNGLGLAVSAMLGTHLRNETSFIVLERSSLNRLIDEKQYMDAGLTRETRDKLKQLYSVEVLLTGEVSALAGVIQIDLRLISVETGEVVAAEYGEVKAPESMRAVISRLVKAIEDRYLRQWMGGLNILVHPVEGEVYLDNQFVGKASPQSPLQLSNLLEGEYRLKILAGGYQPFEQIVQVVPRTVRDLQPALMSLPGALQIGSEPNGAKVVLNGKTVGITPLKLDTLTEGVYALSVEMKNFKPWVQKVRISSGRVSDVTAKLEVIPGTLLLQSQPDGAHIYLNRNLVGKSPVLVENIQPGTVSVEMRLDGYAPHREDIVVRPGVRDTIGRVLRRETGKITLVSALDSVRVLIPGSGIAEQILPIHKQVINVGKYRIYFSKDKYYPDSADVEIMADRETRVEVALKRKPGHLRIADAAEIPVDIFVDGQYQGKTGGLAVDLEEGEHDVFLRNWHGEKRLRITVRADETIEIPAASLKPDRALPWWSALSALIISGMIFLTAGGIHE